MERKERTRRAILDAALELCDDDALVTLSLRQVAKRVGIVPTAFYRHFDSIEALGLALVEEAFASLRSMLRDVRRNAPAFDDLIDDSLAILVDHVRGQRRHFGFIARERYAGPPDVRAEIEREIALFERELATDLAHLPGVEAWSSDDLRVLTNLIVVAVVATAEGILAAPDTATERRAVDTARTQLRMLVVGAVNWRSAR